MLAVQPARRQRPVAARRHRLLRRVLLCKQRQRHPQRGAVRRCCRCCRRLASSLFNQGARIALQEGGKAVSSVWPCNAAPGNLLLAAANIHHQASQQLTRKAATLRRSAAPPMERRGTGRSRAAAGCCCCRLSSPPSASASAAAAAASRRARVFGNMERGVHCTGGGARLSGWFSRAAGGRAAAAARLPLPEAAATSAAGASNLGMAGSSRTGPPAACCGAAPG